MKIKSTPAPLAAQRTPQVAPVSAEAVVAQSTTTPVADMFGSTGQSVTLGDVSQLAQGGGATPTHPMLQCKVPTPAVDTAALKVGVERAIADMDWNALQLESAPDVGPRVAVFIEDGRAYDGPMKEAFVNPDDNSFYLKVTGAGMAGPDSIGPFWYGPLVITDAATRSKADTLAQVKNAMSRFDYGSPLTAAPDLSGTDAVVIADKRPVDGALLQVNVDHEAGQYYVTTKHYNRIEGGEVTGHFGPFDVDHEFDVGTVSGADIRALKNAWAGEKDDAFNRPSSGLPNDVPLKTAIIENDADRGMADGYQYTAHFMPGTKPADGARFWVERSGGFAGLSQVAGPFRTDA